MFCFIQIEDVQFESDKLCFSDLSSKVQPLPPKRVGSGTKHAA